MGAPIDVIFILLCTYTLYGAQTYQYWRTL